MAHGALLNVMWLPDEKAVWRRMDTCRCMVESLHCSPETITMLLIDSTTIQNKKLKKKCVCVCVYILGCVSVVSILHRQRFILLFTCNFISISPCHYNFLINNSDLLHINRLL